MTSKLAGSRHHVKGGLRPSELILLQRAITMYVKGYNEIKAASKHRFEKDEAQGYIDAAYALANRLRHELEPIPEGDQHDDKKAD